MRIEGENSKFGQGFNHFMCIAAYRCAARAKIIQWGELYFEIVFLCLRFFYVLTDVSSIMMKSCEGTYIDKNVS